MRQELRQFRIVEFWTYPAMPPAMPLMPLSGAQPRCIYPVTVTFMTVAPSRLAKIPVVKAKVGPQIVVLIADNQIYDQIPVKKEVKASVSGLFISDVRGLRGPLEKPEKKKPGFFARLTGQK